MALFAGANIIGGLVVYTYLAIAPQDDAADAFDDLTWGPWLLAAYGAVVFPIALVHGVRALGGALGWRFEPRPPTVAERLGTIRLPQRFVVYSMLLWTGGNIAFAIANTINGDAAREVLRSIVGTTLGAATTCAACYLLVERALRPAFAVVLADWHPSRATLGVRPRLALAWALGSGIPLAGIATSPIGPDDASIGDLAVLAAIGLLAGGAIIGIATRSVSDRLSSVRAALDQVRAGDLSVEVAVDEAGEIGMLQSGVNQMVKGMRERQVLQDLFGRHVGQEVARRALEEGVHLGGETLDISVLFIDVAGSTWLAATRPATEVVAMLNDLFGAVVRIVGEEGGWVDKFEGDAALCVFGAPDDRPDHAGCALRAGVRLSAELSKLRVRHPELDVGIGISSGPAVAGNVGAESRFEYTVIGDPVNVAARLTEVAKARPGRLVASRQAVDAAGPDEADRWRSADLIVLRGRVQPTDVWVPVDELDVTRLRSTPARR